MNNNSKSVSLFVRVYTRICGTSANILIRVYTRVLIRVYTAPAQAARTTLPTQAGTCRRFFFSLQHSNKITMNNNNNDHVLISYNTMNNNDHILISYF
jgi:hypothetical protein